MTKRTAFLGSVAALLLAASAFAAPETFQFDKNHSLVGFRIRHFVSKVEGRFNQYDGAIVLDRQNPAASKVDLTIQATSIDTGNENRDKDLRSANFFDVEKYPTITFKSTGVRLTGGSDFELDGDLTIKDTTKPITLEATLEGRLADPFGGKERLGVTAKGQINRMDFGLNWDGLAGAVPMASHTIKLEIDAEIVVKVAEPALTK